MIRHRCTFCSAEIYSPDSIAGSQRNCPECLWRIDVPFVAGPGSKAKEQNGIPQPKKIPAKWMASGILGFLTVALGGLLFIPSGCGQDQKKDQELQNKIAQLEEKLRKQEEQEALRQKEEQEALRKKEEQEALAKGKEIPKIKEINGEEKIQNLRKLFRNLQKGMTKNEVQAILGEPTKIVEEKIWRYDPYGGMSSFYWSFYGTFGFVFFDKEGFVDRWREP